VNHGIRVKSAPDSQESDMSTRKGKTKEDEVAETLRAARLFVGETDGEISAEEARVIEELRTELPRPSKADLTALAKKLAKPLG
jgi:hypothetical protein